MSSRRRAAIEGLVLLSGLAVGVLVEHARGGVETRLFVLGALLLGSLVARALAARGRLAPPPRSLLALEVASLGGLLSYPVGLFGLVLAASAAAFLAWSRAPADGDAERASLLEEALAAALGLGACAAAALGVRGERDAHLSLLGLAVLVLEAWGPRAARTPGAAVRRIAGFGIVLGAWLLTSDGSYFPLLPRPTSDAVLIAGALALLAGFREVPSPERPSRILRALFGASLVANVLILLAHPLLPTGDERIALAGTADRGHACRALVRGGTALDLTYDYDLLEDGRPLPVPDASIAAIVSQGLGRYRVEQWHEVLWSSSDGTDPLANGRRYELLARPSFVFSGTARVAFVLCGVLGLLAWKRGELRVASPSPSRMRVAFALLVAASLGVAFAKDRDGILLYPDSAGYVDKDPFRTPLYPAFLGAFDSAPGVKADPTVSELTRLQQGPGHRLLGVMRAQKVFTVLSIVALAYVLSEVLSVWLVALLVYSATFADLVPARLDSVRVAASSVLSEGINNGLVLLLVAALLAYLVRASWVRGLLLSCALALLFLTRPANVTLAAVFVPVWIFQARQDGWRKASLRVAGLGLAFAVPILLVCAANAARTGHFRLNSGSSGFFAFGVALQTATPDDVDAFHDEPELEPFVRACLLGPESAQRIPDYTEQTAPDAIFANIYLVGKPAFERTVRVPPGEIRDYFEDAVYGRVARRLLARHPGAYAKEVLANVTFARCCWAPLLVGAFAAAGFFYMRSRASPLLFCASVAALPFVSEMSVLLTQPLRERYREPFFFAEVIAAPLLVAVLVTLGRKERNPY
jgi:hypothetical protein